MMRIQDNTLESGSLRLRDRESSGTACGRKQSSASHMLNKTSMLPIHEINAHGGTISRYNPRVQSGTESGEVNSINEIAEGIHVGRVGFDRSASCGEIISVPKRQ